MKALYSRRNGTFLIPFNKLFLIKEKYRNLMGRNKKH